MYSYIAGTAPRIPCYYQLHQGHHASVCGTSLSNWRPPHDCAPEGPHICRGNSIRCFPSGALLMTSVIALWIGALNAARSLLSMCHVGIFSPMPIAGCSTRLQVRKSWSFVIGVLLASIRRPCIPEDSDACPWNRGSRCNVDPIQDRRPHLTNRLKSIQHSLKF